MPTEQDPPKRRSIGAVIKHETLQMVPPVIYFLITFSLLIVTQALVLADYTVDTLDIGKAVIGALLVGKILLIVDHLPFIDRFPDKPLIWNTLWKTLIYNIAALLFRYLEKAIPLAIDKGSLREANEAIVAGASLSHFLVVQLWLGVLFFVYCAGRELFRKVGPAQVRDWFFGTRTSAH